MSHDKIVYMANQIATFFASQPEAERAEGVAAHLQTYWPPTMRTELLAIIAAGGDGLSPLVIEAAERLKPPASAI